MATQFIKNNTNFEAMNNWNGFNGIVEKDGFKSLNLKQTNANYTELIELQEESTYTLWCEIKSMYLQQVSTIKGLLFDCFFVKEDGTYEETIYDACSEFEIVSQERNLQPDKWQVIEIRIHTKSLDSAKDEYTRIMFRPKFVFNEDEENGIDIYIKNVSFEDTDRRYFGNNLLVDSSKCEDEIYKLDNIERTDYRYYGGYIFKTVNGVKGSVAFNVAKELFKRRILRNGDKVRYSMFVRTTSESIKYPNLSFYMKRYNIETKEDTDMYFFRSEFVGQITNEWQKMSYDFTVTSQMIDDSGNNLLWGDTGFFFSGQLNDSGVIYYACPMLEIIGDDDIVRNEWIPHKQDELYLEYWKDLIMCYVETDKLVSIFMRKKGEDIEKEISNFVTSYTESDMSSSDKKVSIGNVGSKTVKIGLRNYDDDGIEILPRDLTNYIFYVEKYFKNNIDDNGDIQFREGKYLVYENPEDFSSNMTLEIQDRMVELDVAYKNELDLPTNVRTQLENIAYLSNMKVDYTDIDETLLNEEVNFYDESYTRRNYLSWIGERASCNLYMNDDTITFKKINKNEYREQYMDYVSQSARLTDKFYLDTVIFDNTIQYYVQSNDLFFNDETIFEIKKDKEDYQNYVNTNVKATLESGKIYTFDFVSNKEKVGEDNGNVKAILKSPSGNNDVDIDAFAKTFVANESGEYTLYFYFYTDVLNDFATFSNFHVVEGDVEYNVTNTLYVNNENMYISKYENLDYIYQNLSGLELMGFSDFKLILGNPRIKSNDLVYFRFIDEMDNESFNNVPFVSYIDSHELTYNKSYTSKLEASIESTNDAKLNSYATSTSARMKRLKVEVDNNSQSISIIGQDIVEVKNDVDLVEERVNTAEIKLQPENIVLSVNQGLLDGSVIRSTKFEIDVDGVHISGGGLDISNNSGTKVFYADSNGNLTLNGTIQASGGSIANWTIGTWAIYSQYVETYIDTADCGISRGCNDDLSYDKNGLAFWAGASWVSDLNRARPSTAKFRVYRDGSMYATSANITGTITGSTITGSTITSNSTINVTTDLRVGYNIYVGNYSDRNTARVIYLNDIFCIRSRNDTIAFGLNDNGSLTGKVRVNSNGSITLDSKTGGVLSVTSKVTMATNAECLENLDFPNDATKITFRGSTVSVYGADYNTSSNLYLKADNGYTAIYSYGNAVYYNGQYIDSNWTHGKFNPGKDGVALGGSASNQRWYRLYAANASSTSSDRRLKENIKYFKDRKSLYDINGNNDIEIFFKDLKPSSFTMIYDKYRRIKFGFIAQDVISSLEKIGLSAYDVDFVSHGRDENGNISENAMYSLCYEEFIALNTHMIQKTISIVDNHIDEINILKDKIIQYENELEMFKSENASLKFQLDILNDKLESIMRGDYEHNEYSN